MNRLLLIVCTAVLTYHALRARELPRVRLQLAIVTAERDAYLSAALKRARVGVLERISAEAAQPPRPAPKAGLRDAELGE